MSKSGLYGKYIVAKADGTDIDPEAVYFVLRLDTDADARRALANYANHTKDHDLSLDIYRMLDELRAKRIEAGGGDS